MFGLINLFVFYRMKLGKKFNYMMSSCVCADFYSRNSFRLTKKKKQKKKTHTHKKQNKKETQPKNPHQFVHIVT